MGDLAITISKLPFSPHAGSGRSLCLWALDNFASAQCMAALAAWVHGVLQLRLSILLLPLDSESQHACLLRDANKEQKAWTQPANDLNASISAGLLDDIDALKVRLAGLTKTAEALEAKPSEQGGQQESTVNTNTNVIDLHGAFREKGAIVEAMQLLEDYLPTVISSHRKSDMKEAWLRLTVDGYEKILEKAKTLKQHVTAVMENLDVSINNLESMPAQAGVLKGHVAVLIGNTKHADFESPASRQRSHS